MAAVRLPVRAGARRALALGVLLAAGCAARERLRGPYARLADSLSASYPPLECLTAHGVRVVCATGRGDSSLALRLDSAGNVTWLSLSRRLPTAAARDSVYASMSDSLTRRYGAPRHCRPSADRRFTDLLEFQGPADRIHLAREQPAAVQWTVSGAGAACPLAD